MTVHYTELHLANNIEALKVIAKHRLPQSKQNNTFERKCRNLKLLFRESQNNIIDQEKTYVMLCRFVWTYDQYYKIINDQKFMESCFKKDVDKARNQLEQLQKELCNRYREKQDENKENKRPVKKTTSIAPCGQKFPENQISCEELYTVLQNTNNNILLVDVRPQKDFKESRMLERNIINISEDIIQSGLSAHCIGQLLPSDSQVIWDKRDSFDVLVLLDWNSTFDTMTSTKLHKLLSAVLDWDANKTYAQKPVILNGGYMEWGQKYPSLCTNPNIVMNKINDELDELLNLDNIQYPDDNKVPIMLFQETPSEAIEPPPLSAGTREELIRKNIELSAEKDKLLNEIISEENRWKSSQNEQDMEQSSALEKHIAELDKKLEQLTDLKNRTQEDFDLYARFDPQQENLKTDELKEMAEIDKSEGQKVLIRQTIAQDRLDALARARALKPRAAGDPNIPRSPIPDGDAPVKGAKTDRPTFTRSNKPSTITSRKFFDEPISFNPEGGGLVGLKNIRNTCYMNTVIQCMKNIPKLNALFCLGTYQKLVKRNPDAIIMETAFVFRKLWSKFLKYFNPTRFYDRICAIEPNYAMGNHEDCMEFFLFLLNNLIEDCAYDMTKPDGVMTPAQEAYFNQLGGKKSIFIEYFYHQIRIMQMCRNCHSSTHKFELESTFMLPVPEYDFSVEDLMTNYMKDYVIDDYCCSKCKKPVTNSKKIIMAPKVLVIILKRYKQVVRNNNVSVSKIDSKAFFPTVTSFIFNEIIYYLNSIAMHSGSMTSGHYTAACVKDQKWYEFNDELVRPINIDDDIVRSKACAFFYSTERSL